MKFKDFQYKRPDYSKLHEFMDDAIEKMKLAKNADEQFAIFENVEEVYDDLDTDANLARIRYFLDTSNEYYKEEYKYISRESGAFNEKYNGISKIILESEFSDELVEKIGYVTVKNIEISNEISSPDIIEDLKEEKSLVLEYNSLLSRLTVTFDNKDMPLSMLVPYKESIDRDIRKVAFIAEGECYNSNKKQLDEIFDKLVKNRTRQANKLGFDNYVELGYKKMRRNCYDNSDIAVFKSEVLENIVPITNKLAKSRKERLNLDSFYLYDQNLPFKDGAAKLQIKGDELMQSFKRMFEEMSPKTADFIKIMTDYELFDLYPKKSKLPGGFCSFFPRYNSPFVFVNLNGTATDVYLLTHEFGHALARHISLKKEKKQYASQSMEISELHSMTMEYLATPWYNLFFGDDEKKYSLSHAEDALFLIAYACQVDEFQERIYKNPNMSPKKRDDLWLELEKIYRPHVDNSDLPFYSEGAGWQRQVHIYKSPFYYIEYAIAEIVAFQIFSMFLVDKEKAFDCYFNLLYQGSDKTFVDLIDTIGLKSPLKAGTIKETASDIFAWILSLYSN